MTEHKPGSPSDYLAAERTFLAWVRTSLAMIGLGFVVARFSLFLQAMQVQTPAAARSTGLSVWFGAAIIVLAAMIALGSTWRYVSLMRRLKRGDPGLERPSKLAIALAVGLALVGVAMAVYLLSVREPRKSASVAPDIPPVSECATLSR